MEERISGKDVSFEPGGPGIKKRLSDGW